MSSSRLRWIDYNKFSIFGDLTNHTEFEPDGTMVFHGDARTYNDLYTGVAGGKVPAVNYPVAGTGTEPTGNPFLGMVGVHYQQNTLGSRTILSK